MSKISRAFAGKKAFIGYVMGGDPNIEATEKFVIAMAKSGADIIEIGVPFSDPIAEGPVIQRANIRALAAGADLEKIFKMIRRLRNQIETPLILLTYLNPVFRYGYGAFCEKCAESGADGVIIPDLPYEEQGEFLEYADQNKIDLISLAAPTSERRIIEIAKNARGFLYMVSSMGVTGQRSKITSDLKSMAALAKSASDIPVAVGFGIHSPEQAAEISKISDGVIVGSAFVKITEDHGADASPFISAYTAKMKAAL